MKHAIAISLCILVALGACRTSPQPEPWPAYQPAALTGEFLRADHKEFSKHDQELITVAWHAILDAGKLPKGGSKDAFFRVRHTANGHEVFAIYVTGYEGDQPVVTPCVHNEVLLSPEGDVLSVLGGPECWP